MAAVSKQAATVAVSAYARVLRSEGTARSDPPSDDRDGGSEVPTGETAENYERRLEAAFISQYAQNRIVDPVRNWYGTDLLVVATAVEALMTPLTDLNRGPEFDVERIEELVSTNLFGPKFDLMVKYREKIQDLQQLLNRASIDSSQPL